jgi:uncharacterized protein with ATP-grasp and redox domains
LFDVLKISITSGLLGLNQKTSASATSKIFRKNIIPIQKGVGIDEQMKRIKRKLTNKANEKMAIDCWLEYKRDNLEKKGGSIVFFTDDYIEMIFDLKFIEMQLHFNNNLVIHLVPRFQRYGNDASYVDVINILEEPIFKDLRAFIGEGRLQIIRNGPRSGTVNGLSISQQVADILKESDCVVVKGARAYEMLQGIQKVSYFGFAVCREISEAVTGIDAEQGKLVFIRQNIGERSFDGFRNRRSRPFITNRGRRIFLSTTTALDNCLKDRG